MKKIVASVGLVALGASGLHAAPVPSIVAEDSKPWTIAATLRGFYDDNINSAPDDVSLVIVDPVSGERHSYKRESWGFEVSPSVWLNLPINQGQTGLNLGYTYTYKWYDEDLFGTSDNNDQTHQVNLGFDHAFSERYAVSIKDSFVIGQDPDMLRAGNAMETFQRVDGDNIRNFGSINFDGKATRLFGYQIGYANSWYDYDADKETFGFFGTVNPSIAGLLNRLEHVGHIDTRWQLQPDTVGVLGYQYRQVNYTEDQPIAGSAGDYLMSDDRDSRTHYGYVGVDHSFRPDFTGALRVGAQFTDYFNDSDSDNRVSPYVLASLKYNYMPESFLEVGYTYDINATDIVGLEANGDFTKDQQSSIIYVALTHRITPKLFLNVNGQYQNSEFNGGIYDDESEKFYTAGISLEYRFTRNFATHVGYAYDKLNSDIDSDTTPRDLDRNRVYFGVTAKY